VRSKRTLPRIGGTLSGTRSQDAIGRLSWTTHGERCLAQCSYMQTLGDAAWTRCRHASEIPSREACACAWVRSNSLLGDAHGTLLRMPTGNAGIDKGTLPCLSQVLRQAQRIS
jgi:hypothetical protein